MKRKYEETFKYQHLVGQMLTLFFSGVYITSHDMIHIAHELGHELPSKNRELILKNLFLECEKAHQMPQLVQKLIVLLQTRIEAYSKLTQLYPTIHAVSFSWIQKAHTIIKLLQQQLRVNPYE